MILCGIAWRLGGMNKTAYCRDVIIPIILGAFIGYELNGVLWQKIVIGILTIGSFNIVRIGYGAYDPEHDDKPSFLGGLLKDRKGYLTRSLAGLLYGIIGLLPLLVFNIIGHHYIFIVKYLGYSLFVAGISYLLSSLKAKDIIIEPLIGVAVTSIIFLI